MTREEWIEQAKLSAVARGVPREIVGAMVLDMASAAEDHFGPDVPWDEINLSGGTLQ